MKNLTRVALLELQNAVEKAHTAVLGEMVERPISERREAIEFGNQLPYWFQQIDNALNPPSASVDYSNQAMISQMPNTKRGW